ncbi:MAG: hypothetical protein H6511_06135 [Holophagales bacterium]|nr:hypothetical protein [Holophagales bacterium]
MKTTRNATAIACALASLLFATALAAAELPAWWPEEVPVLEEATIVEVDEAEDKGLPKVEFSVPAEGHSMESLVTHYADALAAKGWTIDQRRAKGMSDSVTATKRSADRRVIVTAWKPGTIFNKSKEAFRLEVIVYRSIP